MKKAEDGLPKKNLPEIDEEGELPEEDAPEVNTEKLINEGKLDLQMCLAWFAQRGKKHKIHQDEWNKIRQELIYFRRRLNESTLYLGVIGDASVGKSTFINALLGFELLKENVTLGTTSTATILKKGNEFAIKVNYNDNRPAVTFSYDDLRLPKSYDYKEYSPDVAQAIAKFTAIEEETEASAIRSVEVYLPIENELLNESVAIVDTPGLHSGNAWHDIATTNAVKNICDIALILTSAKTPLPQNFVDYLKTNLASVLPRSILVMTQTDTLDEDEREDQLDYVHSRLKSETKTDVIACYGVSAYYSLNRNNNHKHTEDEVSKFKNEFSLMSHALKDYLQKGHQAALFESLQTIIQANLLPVINKVLSDRKEKLQSRRNELKRNELVHLDEFVVRHTKSLYNKISNFTFSETTINNTLQTVASNFETRVFSRIANADDKNELKAAMAEDRIKQDVEALMPLLAQSVNKLCAPLKGMSKNGINVFSKEFCDAYARLQNMNSLNVSNIKIAKISVELDSMDLPTNYFTNALEEQNSADNAKVGGGAVGGAAIGFLVAGPLGALVGGIGGAIFGALFGKSLATLKDEARSTVKQISSMWQSKMAEPVAQACNRNKENCMDFTCNAIQKYVETYGAKINEIISAEKAEQNKLSNNIKDIEHDVKTLIQLGE